MLENSGVGLQKFYCIYIQSNLSYVTFQGNLGNSEDMWSLNTVLINIKCILKGN